MKRLKQAALLLLAIGFCSAGAWADGGNHGHGHGHNRTQVGVYIGGPWFYPSPMFYPPMFYPPVVYPPVYYPPRVIVMPAPQPPVYVEQSPPASANQYWYFCQQANAYYPQVTDCPAGWVRVPPRQ